MTTPDNTSDMSTFTDGLIECSSLDVREELKVTLANIRLDQQVPTRWKISEKKLSGHCWRS